LDRIILDNDLQFIEHSVKEIASNKNIEVIINIFEGEKLIVERVNIRGNSITNESVIRSDLLLDEGDPYNKLKLNQSISRINSRGIFADVKEKVSDGEIKNSKIIDIEIEEKATGEISAGAGIGTNGGSFAFNVSENNWLGKGVRVQSSLQVSKTSAQGSLGVVDPNYKFTGNELNYNLSSTKNDKPLSGYKNSITSLGVGTRYEQFKDIYFTPGISLASDKLTVLSSASDQLKKQAGTFTDLSFRYGFQFDNRNRSFMPTNGTFSNFQQTLPIYSDSAALRNSYSFSAYNEFSENLIGAFKFNATAINGLSKDVRISKRVFASPRRLRGFQSGKIGPKDGIDWIGGNYTTTMNFEAALPNVLPESTKTDIGTFLDIGNVWGVDYDSSVDDSNAIRSAAGVNVSWISPLGPMTVTLAQNITKASTDHTQTFDFQLGTTF
jgi:outer membrane protein insertion porin family